MNYPFVALMWDCIFYVFFCLFIGDCYLIFKVEELNILEMKISAGLNLVVMILAYFKNKQYR